jgi:hypothetical protein
MALGDLAPRPERRSATRSRSRAAYTAFERARAKRCPGVVTPYASEFPCIYAEPRRFSRSPYALAVVIGLMFWLSRNRFVGSYFSFSASNR